MKMIHKRRVAASVAAVFVLGAGAGDALACHGNGAQATTMSFTTFRHASIAEHARLGRYWGQWSTVTSYLSLTTAQLKTSLASGQTLAQVANATPNKSAQGLIDALVANAKTRLDAKVASGRLDATQESSRLTALTAKYTAFVNASWSWSSHHRDNDNDGD